MMLTRFFNQVRNYRKHVWMFSDEDQGRSFRVTNNSNFAYKSLRDLLNETNLRMVVRQQQRFESKPDKRRRKRKEDDWKCYLEGVKRNVRKAMELRDKTREEKKHYKHL